MENERLKAIIESLLLAAGEPLPLPRIAAVLDPVPKEEIRETLATMAAELRAGRRGMVIEEVAGGYQLRTPAEHAPFVRKLFATRPPRLSRPLLETLAIVAYRQPITRAEIERLRGVDTAAVLQTLLERRLIRIAGRKESPGRPLVYTTTQEFLEMFGLSNLESLPDLAEFKAVTGLSNESMAQAAAPLDPPASMRLTAQAGAEAIGTAGQEATADAAGPSDTPGSENPGPSSNPDEGSDGRPK